MRVRGCGLHSSDSGAVACFCEHGNELTVFIGRFIMFSVITNIYNRKTKGPTLMELFTTSGKLKIPVYKIGNSLLKKWANVTF